MHDGRTKILFANQVSRCGGAEISLLTLLRCLDRERFLPLAALPYGPLEEELRASDTPLFPLPEWRPRRGGALTAARQVAAMASMSKALFAPVGAADIVHANSTAVALALLPAVRSLHRPLLWMVRDLRLPKEGARLIAAAATRVVAISEAVHDHLAGIGIRADHVVPSGIDTEAFSPDADGAALRHSLDLPPGTFLIGCAGQMVPWKRYELLLEAVASIPQAAVILAGDDLFGEHPAYRRSLEETASGPELAGRVFFHGYERDMPAFMNAVDAFVLPSRDEPLGRVMLEAMACCRPVVAVREGGPARVIEDGETGLLVDAEEGALAEALELLRRERGLARSLGQKARQMVVERYDAWETTHRLEEIYAEMAAGTAAPADDAS